MESASAQFDHAKWVVFATIYLEDLHNSLRELKTGRVRHDELERDARQACQSLITQAVICRVVIRVCNFRNA